MRNKGIAAIVGGFALGALLLVLWLVGLVTGHTAGGLIHLLMLLAPVAVAAGVCLGVVLLVMDSKRRQGR
jgi:Flp pilus assembly protein TadB